MNRLLIVPAAGQGTRLGAGGPKALVPLCGRPMLDLVLDRYRGMVDRVIVVVSPAARDEVARRFTGRPDVMLEVQSAPTGMLDAILIPRERVARLEPEEVWITWCDQAAIRPDTVRRLAAAMAGPPGGSLIFPTVALDRPYIHFIRGPGGRIAGVLQRREGDPMPEVGEGDIGLFALEAKSYLEVLPVWAESAPAGSGTGERNFLPFIPWLASRERVSTIPAADPMEAVGINTPDDLERVENYLLSHPELYRDS